jgi:ATP/maltotriose-dependent transcriptional regulator MalT/DNA-binding SARP family transcriptional activator
MALFGEELVTRTKFIAPRLKGAHIRRERLHGLLDGALGVPLTVLVAGAGYGKSTLLAAYLEASGTPGLWYELGERDADPQVLALHLAHLVHREMPGAGDKALAVLERPGGAGVHWAAAAEALADGLLDRLEADTLLILDDFEVLDRASDALLLINHLVANLPPRLHVVLASRTRPALPNLARWKLEGDVLSVDQAALAFDAPEARSLFARVGGAIPAEVDADRIVRDTAGWPMAVQLLARRRPANLAPISELLVDPEARRDLFEYLAREVLDVLPRTERDFLLTSAPLARLDATVCDALTGRSDTAALLVALSDRGVLLAAPPGDAFRPHHLFRDFLLGRLAESGRLAAAHREAAEALTRIGRETEAIDHQIAAGDHDGSAGRILAIGPDLVRKGMFETVSAWIRQLPDALIDRTPDLALLLGDASCLAARYESALGWYDRALAALDADPEGRSRALAAKAQVFLDTVRPSLAMALLDEAAKLTTDGPRRANLTVLLAENTLNAGEPARALDLLDEAGSEAPNAGEVRGRLLLRTGRLREARDHLRALIERDSGSAGGAIKAHREAALVLSLVEAFLGEGETARKLAEQGIARSRTQGAAWGEAVGFIRAGHAALLLGNERDAGAHYRRALDISDAVGVDRLTAEPLVGLTVLAGRRGELSEAERHAKRAQAAGHKHGDTWMSALAGLALGAAFADAADPRAAQALTQAAAAFASVGDVHGEARALLWEARLGLVLGEGRGLAARLAALAGKIRDAGLGMLLAGPTLLGFATREQGLDFLRSALEAGLPGPLLAGALRAGVPPERVEPLLAEFGVGHGDGAPGTGFEAIRVRALGTFRVLRGGLELDRKVWGRKIALQLFHLLLVYRGEFMPKTRIIDVLWPDTDPATADGTFRVALNALNKALEPDRASGAEPRYVVRQGAAYTLRVGDDLYLDAAEFERLLDAAGVVAAAGEDPALLLSRALELYEGEFLAEFTDNGFWCDRERERLAGRFAESAVKLARLLYEGDDFPGAASWSQRLVDRDPCAEAGYRLLMAAQYRLGDRSGALRTFERCEAVLAAELDVEPMPETERVRQAILEQRQLDGIPL